MIRTFLVKSLFAVVALTISASAQVRNSSFGSRGALAPYLTQETIETYRKAGWTCPDVTDWPQWWGLYGRNGTVEFPKNGGVQADGYAKLTGENIFLTGYHGLALEDRNYVYTIWARGKGKLQFHVTSYGQNEEGQTIQLTKAGEAAAGMSVEVNSEKWIRYRHLLVKTPALWGLHPWVGVEKGTLDIDDVEILPSTPARDLVVKAESALYSTGALIEDKDVVKTDEAFAARLKLYQEALAAFAPAKGSLAKDLVSSFETELKDLAPYVLTEGLTVVRVPYYNEMIATTQVLNMLAGRKAETPAAVTATEAITKIDYVPGRRDSKPDAVYVTTITPDKILYEENETATVKATVKNSTATEQKVILVASQHTDLDTATEVARENRTIPAGVTTAWTFRYNVGPETYGRSIEVRVTDEGGKELDRWREYYQVAREWFRVQMHTAGRYNNMGHYFANEPTDWGVQPTDAEMWISGAVGYRVHPGHRQNAVKYHQQRGKKFTFYQNPSFSGIMGYEEMRKHPEFVLYDPNGQFAVDPVYGGCPNPMELASPLEIGAKRQVRKPYLDRQYTAVGGAGQHTLANWAVPGSIEYGANCIKEYAQFYGFDGIYVDGYISITKGYSYDGTVNLPENKAAAARMNADVQNRYSRILKEENPYFGTWYNFSFFGIEYTRRRDTYALLGSGVGEGESDEWIRAMHGWKNTATLMELQHTFYPGDGIDRRPVDLMNLLCGNRDYIVQKYGGNVITGYIGLPISLELDKPGLSKWGWPTLNYFMSLITASQHHIVTFAHPYGMPSLEPILQFQTRYSRFLWSPDIKLVAEPEKTVAVKSGEEIWWKKFVYRRETADGYDLILHLVRIPPTEKWDINWVDEPAPLAGVQVSAEIGTGQAQEVYALRPYRFEEEQQAVENKLVPAVSGGKVTVEISPFRYYTMVVFRLAK